ncbi:MAG: adenylate kinase [Chloroflexi bacterium]|nr:adenylate kinase [Chloroflexota bacterium]
MRVVLLGPPGAGKGTQARTLAKRLGVVHVASGDLFREHQAKGTELGQNAKTFMAKGLLVPDAIVIAMVLERVARPDCAGGVVLDGFPRTLEQAKALDRALGEKGLDRVVLLKVSEEELVRRLGGRLICRVCQAPYHRETAPPRVEGRCDRDGGELYQREDDRPEAVRQRFRVYQQQTEPLLDYYRTQKKLREVDGAQEIETVSSKLVGALKP